MNFVTPSPRKILGFAASLILALVSVELFAADGSFYRLDDYSKWVKENKSLLASAVKAMESNDKIFSLKYSQDTGLSASSGHGAPAKLYNGENASLFESVLESQYASMMIKKQASIGFLVPETFRCGERDCAVEFFFMRKDPGIEACKNGAFSASRGKCVFKLGNHWYLKYYWRS